jgi:hypothetical protein
MGSPAARPSASDDPFEQEVIDYLAEIYSEAQEGYALAEVVNGTLGSGANTMHAGQRA